MIDRTEWLEARRKGIGGTDAPAILGLSRYRTAIDVWQDKLGLSPERPQSAPMRWGLALEDAIAKAYVEETGRPVRKVGMRRAKHVRDFPMIGSIDRIARGDPGTVWGVPTVGEPRVVEIKTARSSDGWAGRDEWRDLPPEKRVPADYYVQVQHYLEVVPADVADVAVLFSGSDFRVIEIPRDPEFGADLREEEGAFWRDYVLAEVQPPVTAEDLDFLARKYPTSTDDEKIATPEIAELVDRILELADQAKELDREKDGLRAKVEEFLGDAGRLVTPRATVGWKTQDRTTVGWKELVGVFRSILERIRPDDPTDPVRTIVDRYLSDAVGTTNIDDVVDLYSAKSSVRPFRVDRKKEGAK